MCATRTSAFFTVYLPFSNFNTTMVIPSTVSACFAVLLSALLVAAGTPPMRAFDHLLEKRQSNSLGLPLVDLGYARYMGVANSTTSINYWRG